MIQYYQMRFRWMWLLMLLICGLVGYAAYQIRNIKLAEQRNEKLRNSIQSSGMEIESPKYADDEAKIDWKALAAIKGVHRGDFAGMQVSLKLERRFQSYTVEQLTEAMDEIIASDIPPNSKESFGWMVMEVLVQRNPELALVRYAKAFRSSEDTPLYPLAVAIKGWARKDAAAAVAWYDREIAAGTFVGIELKQHEDSLIRFNTELFTALIDVDLDLAKARASSFKGLERSLDISEVNAGNFAEFVRAAYEKPSDQISVFETACSDLAKRKGYADVTHFMDEISATAEEKKAIVISCCNRKGITSTEDLKTMRMWAVAHAPDAVDTITGNVLAKAVKQKSYHPGMSYDQASELALGYQNDDTLSAFLISHPARAHLEKSLALAEKIHDKTLRDKTLSYLK